MMDDANGFRLIHQRHDFQYVHYVVHGRESSALIIWPHDPVAVVVLCDVAVAVVGMILLSLASFFLVLRAHVSPKCLNLFFSNCEKNKKQKKIENSFKTKYKSQNQQSNKFQVSDTKVWDDYSFVVETERKNKN